ncbi:MAG: creatininase family protein [Acidilobaceae archaeon]
MPVEYARLSTRALEELASKQNVIAVIPLGSIEQHCEGPLGLDSMIAERLSQEACRRLEARGEVTCVILPTLNYGYSPEWGRVKGTISIPLHTYAELLEAVVEGAIGSGFRRIALINAHGGNVGVAEAVLRSIASRHEGVVLALINYWELLNAKLDHAGPFEEAVVRALGFNIDLGECASVGYEGKPRILLRTPREPSKITMGVTGVSLDLEALVEALAGALRRVATVDPLGYSI